MSGDRSINIGGDAVSNVNVAGDRNTITATIEGNLTKVTPPPASTVDIAKELAALRTLLLEAGGEHGSKIGRALDDAAEEVQKAKPDKDEVGSALERALKYASVGSTFVEQVHKLAPVMTQVVGWLGSNWHKLLPVVGLVV